jgi:hypothetical protein
VQRDLPPQLPRCPACGSSDTERIPNRQAHQPHYWCLNTGCRTCFEGGQVEWSQTAYVASRERWKAALDGA